MDLTNYREIKAEIHNMCSRNLSRIRPVYFPGALNLFLKI